MKFAVKKIGFANVKNTVQLQETGHSANSIFEKQNDDLFEEFEEVDSIMQAEANNDETEFKCRFCWQTQATKENPLLKSCLCAGSVGCVHLDCLKSWLEIKKVSKISKNLDSYYWKSFECEICKKAYPLMIKSH